MGVIPVRLRFLRPDGVFCGSARTPPDAISSFTTGAFMSSPTPNTPGSAPDSPGLFRFRYLAALAAVFFVCNIVLRIVLHARFASSLPLSADMAAGFLRGAVNDAAALSFVLLFPATLVLSVADGILRRRGGRMFFMALLGLCCILFVFTSFAEYFFWNEFQSRFNFIAVDYLIYTTEVLRNIRESYPLGWLLSLVGVLGLALCALSWRFVRRGLGCKAEKKPATEEPSGFSFGPMRRMGVLACLYAAAALVFVFFSPLTNPASERPWKEYAKNGVYELFSAYRHNQLDYRAFYRTMDSRAAFALVRRETGEYGGALEGGRESLVRRISASAPEKRPNVFVVIMESMGSKWLGKYTPNLSALAREGLSFSDMMSTGTRTVRGIEAVMLSVPPTPGNSIVRRPGNSGLFNLGTPFHARGYDLSFLYGGISYFDNMGAFFAGNDYKVVDKLSFHPENKTFSTAWGQCDEDLFAESLRRADADYTEGLPFQQVLMTTSNHRPFTYPVGRVRFTPGSSRRGAVNYADYAIGKFMAQARTRPWFDNTIFVFVGDHPSAIAGKTDVPADGYGIVCVMYGPKFFSPQKVDTLCSQIDVGPTLLAALGWRYDSPFFGADARALTPDQGRAWISTYQLLGFRDGRRLVVLRPDATADVTELSPEGEALPERKTVAGTAGDAVKAAAHKAEDAAMVQRAVASYQCAYDLFVGGKLTETAVASAGAETRPVKKPAAALASSDPAGGRQGEESPLLEKDARKDLGMRLLLGLGDGDR